MPSCSNTPLAACGPSSTERLLVPFARPRCISIRETLREGPGRCTSIHKSR
jgi:hypothetical protein